MLSAFLFINFPEFDESLYSPPTPHSNSPWLSKIYSNPTTGPLFNLKSSPTPTFAFLVKSYPDLICNSDATAFNANILLDISNHLIS